MHFFKNIKLIDFSIILVSVLTFCLVFYTLITPFTPHKQVYFGIVDPENTFEQFKKITIENRFLAWSVDTSQFQNELEGILARKRLPIITIEPWAIDQKDRNNYVLSNLKTPKYQKIIQNYCSIVNKTNKKVIFRIGHEMDQIGSRYPWANGDSEGFKDVFRFWVDTCKKETKLVDFMWSPVGVAGLEKYYPGSEYVDIIGLSTFGNPEYEQKVLGKKYNFEDHFNDRYKRVASYGKDVYLAEFGVAGGEQYQLPWLKKAQKAILNPFMYPNLKAVVYFQFKDPNPWVEGTRAPDFRINKQYYPFN